MSRPRSLILVASLVLVTVVVMVSIPRRPDTDLDAESTTSLPITTLPSEVSSTAPPIAAPVPVSTTIPTSTSSSAASPIFKSAVSTVTAADLFASWSQGCPLSPGQLSLVTVSHWGYDGQVADGQIVIATELVPEVVEIFRNLFDARFPVERMEPVEVFGGDDNASMAANNTSGFNCRLVTGGNSYSEHSYGRAIDVNPLVNPYVKGTTVLPVGGEPYVDRTIGAPGMIVAGDVVVDAFAAHGWIWGGNWTSLKDYQHFSTTGK